MWTLYLIIAGAARSGKTTLACAAAEVLGVSVYDRASPGSAASEKSDHLQIAFRRTPQVSGVNYALALREDSRVLAGLDRSEIAAVRALMPGRGGVCRLVCIVTPRTRGDEQCGPEEADLVAENDPKNAVRGARCLARWRQQVLSVAWGLPAWPQDRRFRLPRP